MRYFLMSVLSSTALSVLLTAQAAHAQGYADLFNEWDVPSVDANGLGPTGVEWDFAGNQKRCIPAQNYMYPLVDPWYANQLYTSGAVANPITIQYSGGITRVVMSGSALPVPPPIGYDSYPIGNVPPGTFQGPTQGGHTYHVGLDNGFVTSKKCHPELKRKRWIWGTGKGRTYQDIDVFDFQWPGDVNGHNIKTAETAIFYVGTTDPARTGTWHQATYVPAGNGKPNTFLLSNNGDTPITIGVAGIETGVAPPTDPECQKDASCKESLEDLFLLNDQGAPIPGAAGSRMTELPALEGLTVQPGQRVEVPAQ